VLFVVVVAFRMARGVVSAEVDPMSILISIADE
jgi:hypothetical protein